MVAGVPHCTACFAACNFSHLRPTHPEESHRQEDVHHLIGDQ